VSVAVKVSPQERPHDRLRRAKDGVRDALVSRARSGRESEEVDHEVAQVLGVKQHAPAPVVLPHAGRDVEQLLGEAMELERLRLVAGRETEVALLPAQVAIADQVAEERADPLVHAERKADRHASIDRQRHLLVVGSLVLDERRRDRS
jgi:hypothetical protein